MTSDENDGYAVTSGDKVILQVNAVHARHLHIQVTPQSRVVRLSRDCVGWVHTLVKIGRWGGEFQLSRGGSEPLEQCQRPQIENLNHCKVRGPSKGDALRKVWFKPYGRRVTRAD